MWKSTPYGVARYFVFLLLNLSSRNCPLKSFTILKQLSEGSMWFRNQVCFQCPKLKSTVIRYKVYDYIPELASLLRGISGSGPKNTITLIKERD